MRRQPVIGLIATGDELLEPGEPCLAGRIYESNRQMLAPMLARSGARPQVLPLVGDTREATRAALAEAMETCDGIVTTGGVSVGEFDLVKDVFRELGGSLEFWKVSIKPGKPFVFGTCRGRFLFGLPGNPVSAFVTFLLLVRPALWSWQGLADYRPQTTLGTLAEPFINHAPRRHYVRVAVSSSGSLVRLAGPQASHVLSSLAHADGLVEVPPNATLPSGTQVQVIGFEE